MKGDLLETTLAEGFHRRTWPPLLQSSKHTRPSQDPRTSYLCLNLKPTSSEKVNGSLNSDLTEQDVTSRWPVLAGSSSRWRVKVGSTVELERCNFAKWVSEIMDFHYLHTHLNRSRDLTGSLNRISVTSSTGSGGLRRRVIITRPRGQSVVGLRGG